MANILLIEPDRLLADTYRQSLETAKHQVLMCSSAQSAIFAADAIKPDVVVLELQLIDHSGIEFLYEFRSYPEWQTIPVIVLTQVPPLEFNGSRQLLVEELGVQHYLYKPGTTLAELLTTVDRCVQRGVTAA